MMFANKKLCLLFVKLCMIVVCKAEYDYFSTVLTYVRSNDIVNTISSYYREYSWKGAADVGKGHDEVGAYRADDEDSCEKKLRECRISMNDIPDEILSRRIVNMLLSRTKFSEGGSLFHGHVELEGTALELEALRNFGLGISTSREVAPVLNNVIKTAEFDVAYEYALLIKSLTRAFLNFILIYKDVIIATCGVLYLLQILRDPRCNFWGISFTGIQVIFIVTFFVTWWELLQEQVPTQCEPDKLRWTDKMMGLVSSTEDCKKHYEEKMKNPPLEVTPQLVLLHTILRITSATVVLSSEIGSMFLNFLIHYLPRMNVWIVQTVALLAEFPIIAILSSVLVLFCCYCYYSRSPKNSAPRRSLSRKNERWMTRFLQNPIETFEHVKSHEANNIVVNQNTGSGCANKKKDAVEVATAEK